MSKFGAKLPVRFQALRPRKRHSFIEQAATDSLGLQRVMSGERLMTACRWLENIPGAGSEMAISDNNINAIAEVAGAEAAKRGHEDYRARIAGVIRSQLKKESNGERFA